MKEGRPQIELDELVLKLSYFIQKKILVQEKWDYVLLRFKLIGQTQKELTIHYFHGDDCKELDESEFMKFENLDRKFFDYINAITGGHIIVKLTINNSLIYGIETEFIE